MGAGSWVKEYAVQMESIAADAGLETLLSTADTTAIDFAASKVGVAGDGTVAGSFKLLLTNKPDMPPTTAVEESEKASGYADMTEEDLQSNVSQPNSFNPEMHANVYNTSLFLQTLFQSGYTESGTTVKTATVIPYAKIDITEYAAFMMKVQKLAGVIDENALIRGCLASSVKLSAEEGGTLSLSAEIMAAKWSSAFALTGTPLTNYTTSGLFKKAFLKWQNAVIIMDDAYATAGDSSSALKTLTDSTNTRVACEGMDLTLANGLQAKFYNSETVQSYVLGKLKAEGNLNIPWIVPGLGNEQNYYWKQVNDFRSGIVKHIKIYWGNIDATTDNSMVIDMYVKYRTGGLNEDEILASNMGFSCVQPKANTPSITIKIGYTAANLIRA